VTLAPSPLLITKALFSRLRDVVAQAWASVSIPARMALLPVAAVPIAAIMALTIAQVVQPLPAVVKDLALPSQDPAPVVTPYDVEEFARRLETIFGLEPKRAMTFSDWILEASWRYQLEPEIIASLIHTESSFRKRVRSWAGAIGPAQVMPQIWRDFCGGFDLLDPEQNIYCGAQVLAFYKAECGDLDCALRLYNVGPGNLRHAQYQLAGQRYVSRIESSRVLFDEFTLL
jgi:soluble lytic murein transglycosylase-like protein